MSGSINKCIIVGNVGRDPEIRRTNDGRAIANLSVATSETWRDKATGERKEKTEWHRICVFAEGLVKVIEQYVHKGSKIYIEGSLQTRKWSDKDGVEKYSTEIVLQGFNSQLVLLDGKPSEERQEQAPQPERNRYAEATGARPRTLSEDLDDAIPF